MGSAGSDVRQRRAGRPDLRGGGRLVIFAAWSVFRLARFAVRRPLRALSVVGLVLLDLCRPRAVLLLVACLGAALAVARARRTPIGAWRDRA